MSEGQEEFKEVETEDEFEGDMEHPSDYTNDR